MNEKLPCEIVQDLLPSYVDGLTSDCSAKAVEAHLQGCSACSALYENMKKEYQQPAKREPKQTARSEQEKRLFHKKKIETFFGGFVVLSGLALRRYCWWPWSAMVCSAGR